MLQQVSARNLIDIILLSLIIASDAPKQDIAFNL